MQAQFASPRASSSSTSGTALFAARVCVTVRKAVVGVGVGVVRYDLAASVDVVACLLQAPVCVAAQVVVVHVGSTSPPPAAPSRRSARVIGSRPGTARPVSVCVMHLLCPRPPVGELMTPPTALAESRAPEPSSPCDKPSAASASARFAASCAHPLMSRRCRRRRRSPRRARLRQRRRAQGRRRRRRRGTRATARVDVAVGVVALEVVRRVARARVTQQATAPPSLAPRPPGYRCAR